MKCGYDEVDFDSFYDLDEFLDDYSKYSRGRKCPLNPKYDLMQFIKFPFKQLFSLRARERVDGAQVQIDLFRWLNYTDWSESTLPRDRIFAFLNLAFPTDKEYVRVDYSPESSDRRIFTELAAYIMCSRPQTQYLLPLQIRQVAKRLDLPSWVPDFTVLAYHDVIVTGPNELKHCAGQDDETWARHCTDQAPIGQ